MPSANSPASPDQTHPNTNKETIATLKKAAILAFAAAMLPAAPAGAWDQICMKLPLWKTWYAANFHVVHSFHTNAGDIPNAYYMPERRASMKLPNELGGTYNSRADGRIKSPGIAVNQTKCVDITEIPDGEPFFVYIHPPLRKRRPPQNHHSNLDKWNHQQNRPYRTLNYESWGGVAHAKCKFTRESN